MCLCFLCVNVSSLLRSYATPQGCFLIRRGIPECLRYAPSFLQPVIGTRRFGATLPRRAITRPAEGVRPPSVGRDVNKLFLIPGCLSCNTHTLAQMCRYTLTHSHDRINLIQMEKLMDVCGATTNLIIYSSTLINYLVYRVKYSDRCSPYVIKTRSYGLK